MRPPRIVALAACAAAVALGASGGAALAADDPYAAMLAPTGTCGATADELGLELTAAQLSMQCLTNYARAQAGLAPVQLNAQLNDAGIAKLTADVSCGEFSHTPCGQPFSSVFADYVKGAAGYEIGENIAWGTGRYGTPRETMSGWLHSTDHRENILMAAYTEVGIGYLAGRAFLVHRGAPLWSLVLGWAPGGAGPAPPAAQKKPVPVKKKPAHRSKRLSLTHRP
jgi:uncharacterized protein YkwD